ncbi:cytochrome P450 71A3-like [Olea europaea var. sylvestris]|uniref:cytochrome P450 71A3-like n=1 Tax=Olea europaea var. sylvestris TaxID=158386 RepID=UPI000C1D73B8|nr:cytochrome P450 71A3-like [Olea europaea var. sylvestris]
MDKIVYGCKDIAFSPYGTFNLGDYIPSLKWYKRVDGFNVRVEKLAKPLDEFLDGAVEEHRYKKKRKADGNDSTGEADHVDILLEIQRENKAGFPFGTDTMKADMFAAGTGTTYISLEWEVAELLKHPKTMEKLQNEVRQLARSKLEIIEEDLDKISYMKAVIKENLRLHPPLPLLLPRESTQDTKIYGDRKGKEKKQMLVMQTKKNQKKQKVTENDRCGGNVCGVVGNDGDSGGGDDKGVEIFVVATTGMVRWRWSRTESL